MTNYNKRIIHFNNQGVIYPFSNSINLKFSNIKIQPYVREFIISNKTFLIPSIKIDTNQQNATLELIDSKTEDGDQTLYKKFLETAYDDLYHDKNNEHKPSKEEYVKIHLKDELSTDFTRWQMQEMKKLSKTLGQENGIFKVIENFKNLDSININKLNFQHIYVFDIFQNLGINVQVNNNGEDVVTPTALILGSSIMYSTINDSNEVDWEIYTLKKFLQNITQK